VIEDNPDDALFIRTAFQRRLPEAQIETFADGDAALDALRREPVRNRPAVILLDLNLPTRDGHEILKELKAAPEWRHIPVLVLTASRAVRDLHQSLVHHANAHITKPDDFREYETLAQDIGRFWLRWAVHSHATVAQSWG
jgi:CheY-like chemotaxis protein